MPRTEESILVHLTSSVNAKGSPVCWELVPNYSSGLATTCYPFFDYAEMLKELGKTPHAVINLVDLKSDAMFNSREKAGSSTGSSVVWGTYGQAALKYLNRHDKLVTPPPEPSLHTDLELM